MSTPEPVPHVTTPPGRLQQLSASPLAGPLYILLAVVVFAGGDATGKYLTLGYSVFMILLFRGVVGVVLLLPVLGRRGLAALRPVSPGAQIALGAANTFALWSFYMALRTLTLPDATAIGFVAPIVATLAAVPILGERVSLRQWAAIGAGLGGVLVMVRPGGDLDLTGALFMVACAASYASMLVLYRVVGARDSAVLTCVWTSLVMGAVGLVAQPIFWTTPPPLDLALFLAVGGTGVLGQILTAAGLRRAPVSVVAPLDYTYILFAAVFGWVLFEETIAASTLLGAPIVIAAGLYLAFRRRHETHA